MTGVAGDSFGVGEEWLGGVRVLGGMVGLPFAK